MDTYFYNALRRSKEYQTLKNCIDDNIYPVAVSGLWGTLVAHLTHALESQVTGPLLVITHSEAEAKALSEDMSFFNGHSVYFPKKEIVFFDAYAHSNQTLYSRISAINKVIKGEEVVVISSIEALQSKVIDKDIWIRNERCYRVGDVVDIDGLTNHLLLIGYERVDIVDSPGHYSLRGGIMDIYDPKSPKPMRIEFFDDEIDSIREFDPETQLSIDRIEEAAISPCREIFVDEAYKETFLSFLNRSVKRRKLNEKMMEKVDHIIDSVSSSVYFEGADKYVSAIYEGDSIFLDYFPEESVILLADSMRVREKSEFFYDDFKERFKGNLDRGNTLKESFDIVVGYEAIVHKLSHRKLILVDNLVKTIRDFAPQQMIGFRTLETPLYHGKLNLFADDLKKWKTKGYKISVVVHDQEKMDRLEQFLLEADIHIERKSDVEGDIKTSQCYIIPGDLKHGYMFESFKMVVVTDKELFGASKIKRKKSKSQTGKAIKSFTDLVVSDYIVHESHGIGRYLGLQQLGLEGVKKDYLKIQYAKDDYLYIPVDQMDMVQKYIGAEGKSVKLNKLGGPEWKRTKAKIRKSIEDMTDELLQLYANRKSRPGYAFSSDSEWQKQFEDMFPFEETQDQLRCIDEIKLDMEKLYPMERLLCGDVGFGKTEVALRAIFKAVVDGKQVALLVPTTILAQQHYNNIVERFSKFPVSVQVLSRFRSKKEQDQIVDDVRTGVVDIIVGTHRLLSKDVKFKDLGLLVVDEEQRFGVKHKEQIKQLKNMVDVLSLSATPIPRTLHMSLIGIRDMSVIEDPPEDRYPIQTYVVEQDDDLIREAIIREIERGGQVYFVHNRVSDIDVVTAKIRNLVPDADIRYAHGQMNESKLEQLMMAFLNHKFDVLVCTTIIETGLDISNVNTIIINDADRMGLSQLYQLRGRVGRSSRLAYAYLIYQRDKVLTEIAEKRLKSIKEFTELGSGFKIAMRDLEIRGTGNLLGSEQHGHMASVGYELYCKMLEESVSAIKGEVTTVAFETTIEFKINAFIPKNYILDSKQKMDIYKKIAAIGDKEDVYNIQEEIEDRYGTLPMSVYNLIAISYVKAMAKRMSVNLLTEIENGVKLTFVDKHILSPLLISKVTEAYRRQALFNVGSTPYMTFKYSEKKLTPEKRLNEVVIFLEQICSFITN